MKLLPVNERFHTFQGEGAYTGWPAFFIRLHGCPVHCPWCDSAGTWHKDWVPKDVERLSVEKLVAEIKRSTAPLVVITGGEPLIHDLTDLTRAIKTELPDVVIAVETCGAFEPKQAIFDHVTVSPKWAKVPIPQMMHLASELKLIIEDTNSVDKWIAELDSIDSNALGKAHIYLHPEWSKREDPSILRYITERVKWGKGLFLAGHQTHKYFNADAFDKRANKIPAPLGGGTEPSTLQDLATTDG